VGSARARSAKLSRVENFQTQEEDPDATWKKNPKNKKPTQTPQTTPTQTITTTIKQSKISKNKIPKISPTGVRPFGSPTVTYLLFPTFTFQKKKFLLFS